MSDHKSAKFPTAGGGSLFLKPAVLLVQVFVEGFYPLFSGIYPHKDNHRQDRQFNAGSGMIGSNGDIDRRKYPDAGRGGDSYNDAVVGDNDTDTEEASPSRWNVFKQA